MVAHRGVQPGTHPHPHGIELDNVRLDHVDFWIATPPAGTVPWPAGEDSEIDERLDPHLKPRVPLALGPGESATIYFRLRDEGTLVAPLVLSPRESCATMGRT